MLLTAGLGFKPQHFDEAVECDAQGLWFEVHAENYMVDGGPRRALLEALNSRHPVSLHGVGLSIASPQPPEAAHLRRLVELARRVRPVAVSDHLAWQRWRGGHLHDFLPFPRTRQALRQVADNVARVQDALGSRLLIENPSLYVDLPGHQLSEPDFLATYSSAPVTSASTPRPTSTICLSRLSARSISLGTPAIPIALARCSSTRMTPRSPNRSGASTPG